MRSVDFSPARLPASGALALLVGEGAELSGVGADLDRASGGLLTRAFAATKFTGKKGSSCTVLAPGGGVTRVMAVGLGKADELTPHGVEEAAGTAIAALGGDEEAAIATGALDAAHAAAAAMGAVLRAYRFDRYRTKEKPEDKPKLKGVTVLCEDPAGTAAAWEPLEAVANGVFLARDLVSEPPNVLNPAEMADRCLALEELGVEVEVFGPKEMEKLGFGMLLGVSQGSVNEPRMVVMQWHGASGSGGGKGKGKRGKKAAPMPAAKPLAFIGKGVTFDTGGISIKPAGGMEDMKWDMAGAGAVIGAMAALAGRRAKVDVVGLVGLVENMPGSAAQRPGDVVKSYSGQTVEIINTDAEGRLVLGDVIWYCQERFKPAFMVDLATLTGGIIVSLGHEYAGLFASDDALAQKLLAVGSAWGEKLWRMPLGDAYDKMIRSEIADMKNVGGRPGGSISAACFIQRFTNGLPWAHLDIAGTAWSTKDSPTIPKGATAYGVRLIDRLVAEHYEGDAASP
jgi:leucyl aminopeptidase